MVKRESSRAAASHGRILFVERFIMIGVLNHFYYACSTVDVDLRAREAERLIPDLLKARGKMEGDAAGLEERL